VTITGLNFGASQGASTVTFNGTAGTPTSWSSSQIVVPVPSSATTGYVTVTVSGLPGAIFWFTVGFCTEHHVDLAHVGSGESAGYNHRH